MFLKSINVTNPRNVLMQIPSLIVRNWDLKKGDTLHVFFENDEIVIRQTVQSGRPIDGESSRVAGS